MKILKILFIVTLIITKINLNADNRILFYLNSTPKEAILQAKQEFLQQENIKKLENIDQKTPAEVNRKMLKKEIQQYLHPRLNGFIALYAGYIDYSNSNGAISFPLRHEAEKLYLAVTPRVELIDIKDNTISHKEFYTKNENPTKLYLFEKKETKAEGKEKKQFYWQVTEQKLPNKNRISPLTVVLLTKPKNIYVALGDFLCSDTKHIILPNNIYVLGNSDNTKILLNTLNKKRFFEPINVEKKEISDLVEEKMIMNM